MLAKGFQGRTQSLLHMSPMNRDSALTVYVLTHLYNEVASNCPQEIVSISKFHESEIFCKLESCTELLSANAPCISDALCSLWIGDRHSMFFHQSRF